MANLIRRRGQSLTEYAIVFSVVAAAVVGMQIFLKRGLQAKQQGVTQYFTSVTGDPLGVKQDIGTKTQYEPYYAESKYGVTQDRKAQEDVLIGGKVDRTAVNESTKRATGGFTKTGTILTEDDLWQ